MDSVLQSFFFNKEKRWLREIENQEKRTQLEPSAIESEIYPLHKPCGLCQ